ncbi:hypothetical protein K523DRAFT_355597 [Schizophyllum commune Tattone D]|nr:hypothetical protein K523DRAFT_355597 [Schizophyllum commune Tattone D]
MGTLSCLLPSSAPFHLPHIRHRQAALDTDADADADELASAVNALPGSPTATTTGRPNGLVVVKKAVACKCPQYLPRTPNATAYGLFNDYLGIILDLTKLRKCINVLTPSGPNTTAIGFLNDTLDNVSWTLRRHASASMYRGLAQWHGDRAAQCLELSPLRCHSRASMALERTQRRDDGLLNDDSVVPSRIFAWWRFDGNSLLPSTLTFPFHPPHIRHRQPALDTDIDELASAVNALPGSLNTTTTGQPNGLCASQSRQELASAANVCRGSPMPLRSGSSMILKS